jgi:hypothetical protein
MIVTASRGRGLDLALGALAAVQLGGAALLVPRGDAVALPGGATLGGACWWRAAFHVDCPFCGMTRSFVALAHGHLAMLATLVAIAVVTLRRGRPLSDRPRFLRGLETVALACVAMGIIKLVRS